MSERRMTRGFGFVAKEVARDRSISAGARTLYMVLATYVNDQGECWPSNETLCADLGASDSTVRRLQDELIAHGVLEKEHRTVEGRRVTNLLRLTDVTVSDRSPMTEGAIAHTSADGSPTHERTDRPHVGDRTTPVNNTKRTTQSRASAAPDAWPVTAEQSGTVSLSLAEWAEQEFGIKNTQWLQRQVDACLDWARANGKKKLDWPATIRNWVRSEVERAMPARTVPTLESSEPTDAEIRQWLRDHPMRVDNPVWTALREASLDGTDEVPRLEEEWRLERRRIAIEALQAER